MEEAQKETSSLVKQKEKKSTLDDEIGKEFLSSWKSVCATEDVTMDLDFDTVPSGKKKKFNFGKLDMDFNLDAEFDKLSSFKMDMPELDFTTNSPKKTAKAKGGSEGESSKKSHQDKKDRFSFSFDFNELENIDFCSSLMNGPKSSEKSIENKQVAAERKGLLDSQIHLDEGITDDNLTTKLQASEIMATSNVDTLIDELGAQHSSNEACASESGALENLVVLHGTRTSPDESPTKNAEEIEEQSQLPDKATPLQSDADQTLQIPSSNFIGQDDRDQNIVSDIQTEIFSLGVKQNMGLIGEPNFSGKLTPAIGSKNEKSQVNCAQPLYITGLDSDKDERRESSCKIAMEKLNEAKSAQGDTSNKKILLKKPDDINSDLDIHSSAAEFPLVELESEPPVEKVILVKESEPGVKQSKYFKKSEVCGSELQRPSLTAVEVYSHRSKPVRSIHTSPTIEKGSGEDAVGVNGGCKLIHTGLHNKEGRKRESLAAEKRVDDHNSLGEVTATCSTENRTKSCTQTSINPKHVVTSTEGFIPNSHTISVEGLKDGKRTPDLSSLKTSSATCSTDKTTRSKTEASINPKLVVSSGESFQSSTISLVERIITGKRTPDFSKILRTMGPRRGQSNTRLDNEVNPKRNLEKNMEEKRNTESRTLQPVHNSERKMPLIVSLKRKTFEASDAEFEPLKPLKRLSITPGISRNIEEPAKSVVDQISVLENLEESKANDYPTTSGLERPPLDMIEHEVSMVVEDDGNVGKAEKYTRELEDICSMLKKKHEEAKEILVRALVNNNNLLMLNHPIYEDKIRRTQKFAAQLSPSISRC